MDFYFKCKNTEQLLHRKIIQRSILATMNLHLMGLKMYKNTYFLKNFLNHNMWNRTRDSICYELYTNTQSKQQNLMLVAQTFPSLIHQ